jgi:predicted dehydrogenase
MDRRQFLNRSILGTTAMTALSYSNIFGANERVRIALLGCGGRGRFVARGLIDHGAELAYLCDLKESEMTETEEFINQLKKQNPKKTKNMHTVFNSQDVDAVVVATPDHWHGPASIMAVQAGKDVYVEKPHAHNIFESQQMKKAAFKYDRIIQSGTQNRSAPYNLAGREYVKSGQLGKIGLVKVNNLKSGGPFKLGKPQPVPEGFDWGVWLGPAPNRPFYPQIWNGDWHRFWDFSGGDLADDGIHQLDLAMMLLGDPGLPQSITCIGDRKVYNDDSEVPDVQTANFDFKDFILTLELTNYPRYMQKTTSTIRRNDEYPYWTQNATRVELYGSELMMTIGRHGGGWQVTTSGGKVVEQMYGRPADGPHYANFLGCVKTRKQPTADVAVAHSACSMIHMANIAHRLGNTGLKFEKKSERFVDNQKANQMFKRIYRKRYEVMDKV